MASIIEAVEDIFQDNSALFKIAVYAVPVFFTYRFYEAKNPLAIPLGLVVSLLLLGFMSLSISVGAFLVTGQCPTLCFLLVEWMLGIGLVSSVM